MTDKDFVELLHAAVIDLDVRLKRARRALRQAGLVGESQASGIAETPDGAHRRNAIGQEWARRIVVGLRNETRQ